MRSRIRPKRIGNSGRLLIRRSCFNSVGDRKSTRTLCAAGEGVAVVWLRSVKSKQNLFEVLTKIEALEIGGVEPGTEMERPYPVTLGSIRESQLMTLTTKYGFLDMFDHIPNLPNEDVAQIFDSSVANNNLVYVSLDWLRRIKAASSTNEDQSDLENLPE